MDHPLTTRAALYEELRLKNEDIVDIKCKIEILDQKIYDSCAHVWESQPRSYGDHIIEFRCSSCFFYKK